MKAHFFTDKSQPNLIEEYDVLGFDADHCMVKYNVKELMTHINNITANDLQMRDGYPKELCVEVEEMGLA